MFWTTLDKVCQKIDGLVAELDLIGQRISHHEEQFETAKVLGLAQPGDDEVIALWRRVQLQIITNLPIVKADIISGKEDFHRVNRALKFTKQQVGELGAALAQADRDEAVGRRAARERFGG